MKIRTPHYYKDFKCIAGACTDTCCAGWEVDVDAASYSSYQQVPGTFGKRLKEVMVPSPEGGCTFTLKDGRCPFLNEKNLCDLYTALGETHLCETCAEFPRFINEYGSVREIGIAPSCKTAGALILNCKEKGAFEEQEDGKPVASYNDIDAGLYLALLRARETAYEIAQAADYAVMDRCILLLDMAQRIQQLLDREQDHKIAGTAAAFSKPAFCAGVLKKMHNKYAQNDTAFQTMLQFFEPFEGMEIINPDWLKYCGIFEQFIETCRREGGAGVYRERMQTFLLAYQARSYEYGQLLMYYLYRYFLNAVYDYELLNKMKNAVVGIVVMLQLDSAVWHHNGGVLTKTEQIDIAHLYSRQFEHSYTNYAQYQAFFEKKRCYSASSLMKILIL